MRILAQVRGVSFRPAEARTVAGDLLHGEPVILIADPTNKYDPCAVQVHARGVFIGYIQKELSADVTDLLDDGVSATVYSTIGAPMLEIKTAAGVAQEKRIVTAAGD